MTFYPFINIYVENHRADERTKLADTYSEVLVDYTFIESPKANSVSDCEAFGICVYF